MKAIYKSGIYKQSDTVIVQDREEYNKKIKAGYIKIRSGNGVYKMYRSPTARVTFTINNIQLTVLVREIILSYCGGKNLSEKKFNKFCDAWQNEKMFLAYNDFRGLYL